MPQLMRKKHFKLMYEEIKHLYKDIRIRLVAEDITLFLITNPQIRNQSENDKMFNVAINIQIHRVMEASGSSYESSVDYVNFFLGLQLKTKLQPFISFPQTILNCFHPHNILKDEYYMRLNEYYHSQYTKEKKQQFSEL